MRLFAFCLVFGLACPLCAQSEIVVKDTISDSANWNNTNHYFLMGVGKEPSIGTGRTFLHFVPQTGGKLHSLSILTSFQSAPDVPNNNPTELFSLGFAVYDSLAEMQIDPLRFDLVFDANVIGFSGPIGNVGGFNIYQLDWDISQTNTRVIAGNSYFIGMTSISNSGTEAALVRISSDLGDQIGAQPDYYYFGFFDVVDTLDNLPIGGFQFVSQITITIELGDINGDGSVDLLDVAPFVELLTNGGFQPEADINQDGVVDLLDVAPFVDLLSGG